MPSIRRSMASWRPSKIATLQELAELISPGADGWDYDYFRVAEECEFSRPARSTAGISGRRLP